MRNLSLFFTLMAVIAIWNLTSCTGTTNSSRITSEIDTSEVVEKVEQPADEAAIPEAFQESDQYDESEVDEAKEAYEEDYEEDYEEGTTNDNAWVVNSPSQLENNIKGTIWTCRPAGSTWYRLEFKGDKMYLSYAEPSLKKKWIGYLNDQNEHDIYAYRIKERYSSDTGEECMSIQFHHLYNERIVGSLNFFKSGHVEFSWIGGKYGGPAECRDYNWE